MSGVRCYYFFQDAWRFPWELFDGVPKSGEAHSYLASMLCYYGEGEEVEFLKSRPSLRDLERSSAVYTGLTKKIYEYSTRVYMSQDRRGVASEVLMFLSGFKPFVDDFQKRIDILYKSGRIDLPKKYRPVGEQNEV